MSGIMDWFSFIWYTGNHHDWKDVAGRSSAAAVSVMEHMLDHGCKREECHKDYGSVWKWWFYKVYASYWQNYNVYWEKQWELFRIFCNCNCNRNLRKLVLHVCLLSVTILECFFFMFNVINVVIFTLFMETWILCILRSLMWFIFCLGYVISFWLSIQICRFYRCAINLHCMFECMCF